MPNSCQELRDALAQCLQESDCVMVQRNQAADCLREPLSATLPTKCQQLKKGYGDCKRGMVDMRKRFRGNMPAAYKSESSNGPRATDGGGGGGDKGYQLYAGSSAFGGVVKETSGNEPVAPDWRDLENERYRAEQAALAAANRK
ncbi:Cytochrome c oxidase assembly [Cordyceps militaris]|uniref:Cytochrome c oxidase assembly n=1 Tax=Cordyceps militaris TaxID=73501 RepID=A0A2H4SD33_CORMI|nr:Cytochrome c oxidase assembly [Cordyceps militaris]